MVILARKVENCRGGGECLAVYEWRGERGATKVYELLAAQRAAIGGRNGVARGSYRSRKNEKMVKENTMVILARSETLAVEVSVWIAAIAPMCPISAALRHQPPAAPSSRATPFPCSLFSLR